MDKLGNKANNPKNTMVVLQYQTNRTPNDKSSPSLSKKEKVGTCKDEGEREQLLEHDGGDKRPSLRLGCNAPRSRIVDSTLISISTAKRLSLLATREG